MNKENKTTKQEQEIEDRLLKSKEERELLEKVLDFLKKEEEKIKNNSKK